MFDSLNQSISQAAFGRLINRSEGRVSQWASEGLLRPAATALEWLHAVVDWLSLEAAGRASDGPLDLSQERAALARTQRQLAEVKLKQLKGQYAPISALAATLAAASVGWSERLDHLPSIVRRRHPELPADVLDTIGVTLAEARNQMVDSMAELMTEAIMRDDFGLNDDEPADESTPP